MSEDATVRSGGGRGAGAAERRPRRLRGPGAAVPPEKAFLFSPRTLGCAIGLFAIGYLVLAFQMPDYTAVSVPVQPSTLPRWLGAVLLLLAVLLFFQRPPAQAAPPPDGPARDGSGRDESGRDSSAGAGEGPAGPGGAEAAPAAADGIAAANGTGAAQTGGADATASADGGSDGPGAQEPPAGTGAVLGRLADPRLETGLFVGALCLYVALFEPLGFVLSTALYLGSMTWYLGYRRHLVTAAVALALPFALYAGMTWGLGVALPSGPLPF